MCEHCDDDATVDYYGTELCRDCAHEQARGERADEEYARYKEGAL